MGVFHHFISTRYSTPSISTAPSICSTIPCPSSPLMVNASRTRKPAKENRLLRTASSCLPRTYGLLSVNSLYKASLDGGTFLGILLLCVYHCRMHGLMPLPLPFPLQIDARETVLDIHQFLNLRNKSLCIVAVVIPATGKVLELGNTF